MGIRTMATVLLLVCGIALHRTFGQENQLLKYELDSRILVSDPDKQLPFWARSMQKGKIQPNSIVLFDLGIYKDYGPFKPYQRLMKKNRRIDFAFGFEAAASLTQQKNQLIVPQAYAKARYGNIELAVGRFYETISFMDTTMTMGSYIWSGNAMPIPKISIRTEGFVPIKFTKGLISLAGLFSHGWFDDNRFVKNPMLHQKALYGQIGKPYWRIKFMGGLNHQAQWGGTSPNPIFGKMPTGLKDYFNVIFGNLLDRSDTTYSVFDRVNRIGNHLGSLDMGIEYEFENFKLRGYRQNFYDDGSLYYLTNLKDGLQGIVFSNKEDKALIKAVTLEFMYSKSQGGSIAPRDAQANDEFGRDDYFNHAQYTNGWTYHGHVIGTPFFSLRQDLPNPSEVPTNSFIANNRVAVWHLGVAGNATEDISFLGKISYSSNSGTYNYAFEPSRRQLSVMMEAALQLPDVFMGSEAKLSFFQDKGDLWEDNWAIGLTFITRNFESRRRF